MLKQKEEKSTQTNNIHQQADFLFLHSLSFFIDLWFKYNTQYPLKIAVELLPLIAGYLWITFFFRWNIEAWRGVLKMI